MAKTIETEHEPARASDAAAAAPGTSGAAPGTTDATLADPSSARDSVSPPVKGLRHFSARRVRQQKAILLLVTIGPLLALAAAMMLLWGRGLAGADVVAFVAMYVVSILGVTVGFHRQLTHAGFDSPAWVRNSWAALGSLAVEGGPIDWVADHRRHHAHSDKEGDPHSPHLHDDSFVGQLRGFWHAHVGWMLDKTHDSDPERWAPDLLRLPGIVRINRLFPAFVVLSLVVLPGLVGLALTDSWIGVLTAVLWGGPIRMMVGHHVTWSTNSICHVFGRRDFASDDMSTNNWALSLLSMGESWHNNHHAFPSSAVHGLRWWQVDVSALVIRTMERLRIVRNVRVPSPGALERKRLDRQPARPDAA